MGRGQGEGNAVSRKSDRNAWKQKVSSEEASELEAIDARIVEIDAERQTLTDRRRRLYDRARKREMSTRAPV